MDFLEGVVVDMTERKQAEAKINESLAEKEVLLREIHHRVKNNFQVIASLLSLHADKNENPTVRNALEDSRHRVIAMAQAHEQLYKSENLANISANEYLTAIIQGLNLTAGLGEQSVSMAVDI